MKSARRALKQVICKSFRINKGLSQKKAILASISLPALQATELHCTHLLVIHNRLAPIRIEVINHDQTGVKH
jgi:hypothetical protein